MYLTNFIVEIWILQGPAACSYACPGARASVSSLELNLQDLHVNRQCSILASEHWRTESVKGSPERFPDKFVLVKNLVFSAVNFVECAVMEPSCDRLVVLGVDYAVIGGTDQKYGC